jgi:membrane protein
MRDAVKLNMQRRRAQETGRGREARRPRQIPWAGWKDILWRTYREISDDRLTLVAAGTTFYLLLALFPFLTAFVSIYGLVADPVTIQEHLTALQGFLPPSAVELLSSEMTRLIENSSTSLSLAVILGLLIALWSATSGVRSMFEALNIAYDEEEKRGFVKIVLIALAFTVGTIVVGALLINALLVLPLVLETFLVGAAAKISIQIVSALIALAILVGVLMLFYRYGPSRDYAQWSWLVWGAVFAAVTGVVVSALFSWYLANFADYSATYGSLGAAIGLMMWIWISVLVVLAGAELNSEIEHQTAQDTTTGPESPMGERGAVMADSVGESR